jgi:pimeloyl-ACP methyl ester carboxylesterase
MSSENPRVPEAKIFTLSDGSKLTYFDNEVPGSAALLMHHGTPGLGDIWSTWINSASSRGVRAVSYSRAGYLGSDRAEGRTVWSTGTDFEELLAFLGISEFVSIGWSGGGPYALGSTFLTGCKGAELVAGVAPLDEMGADWYTDTGPEDTPESIAKLTESVESALQSAEKNFEGMEELWSVEAIDTGARKRTTYEDFSELYAAFNEILSLSLLNSLKPTLLGYAEDDHVILKPWGFKVGSVNTPVSIWNGSLDKGVTVNMAQWLHGQINNSTLHIIEDQNHVSPMVELMEDILASAIQKLKA